MFSAIEPPILVAETSLEEACRLGLLLRQAGRAAQTVATAGQVLEIVGRQMVHQAVVAMELTIEDEPILARLSRLPAMRRLVAVGPAAEPCIEQRARQAGAQVYLPRPVAGGLLVLALFEQTRTGVSARAP